MQGRHVRKTRIRRREKRNLNEDSERGSQLHDRVVMVLAVVRGKNHVLLVALEAFLYPVRLRLHLELDVSLLVLELLRHCIQRKREQTHCKAHTHKRKPRAVHNLVAQNEREFNHLRKRINYHIVQNLRHKKTSLIYIRSADFSRKIPTRLPL